MADIDTRKVGHGVLVGVISAIIFTAAGAYDMVTSTANRLVHLDELFKTRCADVQRRLERLERQADQGARFTRSDGDKLEDRIIELERHFFGHE